MRIYGLRGVRRPVGTVLACIPIIVASLSFAFGDTLTVQGSTTFTARLFVPHQTEIERVSGHKLEVIPNKSVNGLIALLEGRADLAMISAPIEDELTVVRSIKPNLSFEKLKAFEISRVRVAFAVHPSNPVRSATLDQIRKILLGNIDNWLELGGPNLQIRPVIVREGGGVTVTVQAKLLDGQFAAPSVIRVQTPSQVLKVVEQEAGALGVSQLMLVRNHGFFELKTDKPIEQQLSLITLGSPSNSVQSVIDATRTIAKQNFN